jgi:S-adenosylmethionine synthetase
MTLESVAGKNPVTHGGKRYNIAAGLIVADVIDEMPDLREVRFARERIRRRLHRWPLWT